MIKLLIIEKPNVKPLFHLYKQKLHLKLLDLTVKERRIKNYILALPILNLSSKLVLSCR